MAPQVEQESDAKHPPGAWTGPMADVLQSLDGTLEAEVTVDVPLGNGHHVSMVVRMPLAEIRARFGNGSQPGRLGRDWKTAEVAEAVGESAYTVKRRLREEPHLKEVGGVYRRTKERDGETVEYGSYRFPEEKLPAFLAAYKESIASSEDGMASDSGTEAQEPPSPTPPVSDPMTDGLPDDMDSWKEEYDD